MQSANRPTIARGQSGWLTAGRLALAAMLLCGAGPAPDGTVLPGIGPRDPRVRVDPAALPWSALARLQIPGVSRCTAVLLAPRLALTAAHCLYGRRLGHFAPAASVHLLSRYPAGDFAAQSVAAAIRIADGYDPARPDATRTSDVALLTLATPLAADGLALARADPAPGTPAMLGGYSQDRAEIVTADQGCHILGVTAAPAWLLHDCTGTRGTSGAPVLVREDGGWRIAGIEVGAVLGRSGGIAIPLAGIRRLLAGRPDDAAIPTAPPRR